MAACPYQVRTRNSKTGEVDKCRFCTLSSYENGTKMCSCVDACLTGARIFGDDDHDRRDEAADAHEALTLRVAITNEHCRCERTAAQAVGLVMGLCVAIYTGCLLGVCQGFPLWNSALLPILFLVSA